MTHAPTMTTIRLDLPPGIASPADAEPVARILAARWAEVTGRDPEDHKRQALFSVCLAAAAGDDEVVVRIQGRLVQ